MKWIEDKEIPEWLLIIVAPAIALVAIVFMFWSFLTSLGEGDLE